MPEKVTYESRGIPIAAHLYLPPQSSGKAAAIVVSHPFGGIKEQTAGLYAKLLSEQGFITLAFDAAYQGQSGGEPRFLEDPYQRAEDVRAGVSFLVTRPEVDENRVGALGICASGGYVPFAAQTDRRIKAVATVSGADTGRLFREGLGRTPSISRDAVLAQLEQASRYRSAEAKGEKPHLDHVVPNTVEEVPAEIPPRGLYREGTDYYRTPRAQNDNSPNWFVSRSMDLLLTYDSFRFVDLISPHPLLMIAGGDADTLYFSEDAIKAAKEPKELFVIPGKSHIDLYDQTDGVLPKLTEFMKQHLEA